MTPQKLKKTVLLTGATGFIAKHICVQLLDAGYCVRGSLRSLDRADEVHDAVSAHVNDKASIGQDISFVELDLNNDGGWAEAMAGIDVLIHTASPFPMEQPDDEEQLIRPAVDGALRAVKAANAAGIKRIIMTSSSTAIANTAKPADTIYDEDDWSDLSGDIMPYAKSKTVAEKAVWDYVHDEAPNLQVTMINPGFVLGPALDDNYGTSLQVIERLFEAKEPAVPNFGFSTVHVHDIAKMHVKAIDTPDAIGKRFIGVSSFMWFPEMARVIAAEYPGKKIPTRIAPNFLIKILGIFDKSIRQQVVPNLGIRKTLSNQRAKDILGIEFIEVDQAVRDAASSIIEHNPR